MNYDLITIRDIIFIKPCTSENNIIHESDFSDKILLIYLYIISFWILSFHDFDKQDELLCNSYSEIYVKFFKYLKKKSWIENTKNYINFEGLGDNNYNGKKPLKFFLYNETDNDEKKKEIFKKYVFPFILDIFDKKYASELYTLSWLNDLV